MSMLTYTMEAPAIFGPFHICFSLVCIGLAVICARIASRLEYESIIKLLAVIGWILFASEIFKQFFVYTYVSCGVYNFWYFPFQLCSVPMYLCILLPFCKGKVQSSMLTFMASYSFVSAVATFIYPEDILRPQLILTLHGFNWHALLLFVSLTIAMSGIADLSFKGFLNSTYLFLFLCCVAIAINVATEIVSSSHGYAQGYANMFYLSPYHPSGQPIVSTVEKAIGRIPSMALYVASIICAAAVTDRIFSFIWRPV